MERKSIRTFEDLLVWQKAIEFVREVYLITSFTEAHHDRLRERVVTLSKYLFNQMNSIRNAPA